MRTEIISDKLDFFRFNLADFFCNEDFTQQLAKTCLLYMTDIEDLERDN